MGRVTAARGARGRQADARAKGKHFCSRCKKEKPSSQFYCTPSGRPRSYCKPCWRDYLANWRHANKGYSRQQGEYRRRPEVRRRIRRRGLLVRFGLTEEQFLDLWDSRSGCCHICGDAFPPESRDLSAESLAAIHIDHDHESRRVRGLLCGQCNLGLGQFRDNPAALRKAADYLEVVIG